MTPGIDMSWVTTHPLCECVCVCVCCWRSLHLCWMWNCATNM